MPSQSQDRLGDSYATKEVNPVDDDYDSERDMSSHQQLRQYMTPQHARQKAYDLSCEIGALIKIKERLERQRERLLIYCSSS
jgi:hypothetical protein